MDDLETLKCFKMGFAKTHAYNCINHWLLNTRVFAKESDAAPKSWLLCFTYSNRFKRLAFATSREVINISSRRHRFSHVTSAELVAAKRVFSLSQKNSARQSQFQNRLDWKSTRVFPEDGCIQSLFSCSKKRQPLVSDEELPA
ncbi:Hypothetical_protein [Hexamita inflata]|uniref:Hypothetical_protein n=1 Tax=Hexamita inflata TaxID=28002 RepID=A0AA86QZF7_9EUKA|nr:Hypothetical protein HINF_LOCUS50199 [Hexamita inflata]